MAKIFELVWIVPWKLTEDKAMTVIKENINTTVIWMNCSQRRYFKSRSSKTMTAFRTNSFRFWDGFCIEERKSGKQMMLNLYPKPHLQAPAHRLRIPFPFLSGSHQRRTASIYCITIWFTGSCRCGSSSDSQRQISFSYEIYRIRSDGTISSPFLCFLLYCEGMVPNRVR